MPSKAADAAVIIHSVATVVVLFSRLALLATKRAAITVEPASHRMVVALVPRSTPSPYALV